MSSGKEGGRYELTPERRALLNTIRYAEGTWKDGEDKGYRIIYGGGQFQDLSRHPEQVIVNAGPGGGGLNCISNNMPATA